MSRKVTKGEGPKAHIYETDRRKALHGAKHLYFRHFPVKEIVAQTGVPETVLKWKIYQSEKSWKKARDAKERAMVENALSDNLKKYSEVTAVSLELLLTHMKRMLANGEELSPKDLKMVSDIAFAQEKIFRLRTESPTEIIGRKDLSPKEVKEAIDNVLHEMKENDPFSDPENVH